MKKLNLLFVLLILSVTGMAQTDGLSYQAVILDPEAQEIPGQDITNNVLINAPLTVRFTILKRDGTILYKETQGNTNRWLWDDQPHYWARPAFQWTVY